MKYLFLLIFLTSSLFARPDFLIIGVAKCGTTSLFDYLVQHPKILGAKEKDFHYFMRDNLAKSPISNYHAMFPKKKCLDEITGEASALYFWSKKCLPRIAKHCPKAKLILILRDPSKRAISHYFYFNNASQEWRNKHRRYWENLTFEKVIKQSKAWSDEIINQGYYFEHLQRWLKFYPREQLHIILLEDLTINPEQEVNKVFKFLGLESFKLNSYAPENSGSYKNGSIQPETIEWLKKLYEPHNKQLETFLNRTLPWK